MTAEPLGPALAAELGGVWDATTRTVVGDGWTITCAPTGGVRICLPLGSFSDGAAALARRARRLGVA